MGQASRARVRHRRCRCALDAVRKAAVEALEARRLMCADAYIGGSHGPYAAYDPNNPQADDTRIIVKTDGFEAMVASEVAEAAPGMPVLNSRPGAPTAIFLDFDGDAANGGTNPYDDDGSPTTFNAAEAEVITHAWEEMSTYFAMFDVNVTTIQPANGFPTAWVAIGNNINNGYSYVNVFPNSMTAGAKSWNNSSHARTRVSGIAHEIGHNFGLQHQSDYNSLGVKTNEYSSGYDSLHGPLMGVDYAQSVHKWFIGHPATSASSLQDDLAVIANKIKPYQSAGGDGFVADDFGNSIGSATPLTLSGAVQSRSGLIERIADVDAFSFTVADPNPFKITAAPVGVSGVDLKLGIYAADGTLLAMKDATGINRQDLTLALAPGTYYALLSSHGNYGDVGQYDLTVTSVNGFMTQDVGTSSPAGSATWDAGSETYTLTSNGVAYDNFRFAYQQLTGDGSVTARVDSMTGSTLAGAGVMIRENLATNSKYAWVQASLGAGNGWTYRTTTGGAVNSSGGGTTITAPYWVRLTRTGNSISLAKSPDGIAWTGVTTLSISMANTAYIGLAVSGVFGATAASAVFSNVTLTGNFGSSPAYNALPAPASVAVAPSVTGTGMTVTWDDIEGESGYLVERSSDGVGWSTVGTPAAGVTSHSDSNLPGSLRYFYRVSSRGDGNATVSIPSTVVHGINRPSAVANFKVMSLSASQVVIDWRDTDGESGYRVERSTDGVSWSTLATLAANVPSFSNSGLSQGLTYQYRITPLSAVGDGVSNTVSAQTRLSAVSGLAVAGVQPTQIKLVWTGQDPNATGYRVQRSTNNSTWSTVATLGDVSSYTDNAVTQLSKYYYRVAAFNSLTESLTGSTVMAATPSSTPMAAGWNSIDIGSVPNGAAAISGGSATIIGSGSVGSTSDRFHFLFRPTSGDGEVITRVGTLDGTSTSMAAGIMFRASLADNANFVYLHASSAGVNMTTRGGTRSSALQNDPVAVWLKLVRSGNVFTGYYSADGSSWTQVGTATNTLPAGSNALVGFAVNPQTTAALLKATFDSIGGSALGFVDDVAPAAPVFTAISNDTGVAANDRITSDNTLYLNGTAEPASWVTISRTDIGVIGTVQASYQGNFAFDYTATPLTDGSYTFTATATDGANNLGATSNSFAVTIDTVAPTVIGWAFNPLTQRVEVHYSESLSASSVGTSDITLQNLTTAQSPSVTAASWVPASQSGAYGTGGIFADGHWRAALSAGAVADPAGNTSAAPSAFEFYYNAGAGVADADAYEIRLAPGGAAIEVIDGGATHTVLRVNLDQIILAPGGGTDTVHLDFTGGDWVPQRGLSIGATESLRVTGGPGTQTYAIAGNTLSASDATWNVDLASVQMLALAAGGFSLLSDLAGRALHADAGAAVDANADLVVSALSITANSTLNLKENDLIVRNAGFAEIEALITGGGLISTAAGGGGYTTLGIGAASSVLGLEGSETDSFAGQTVYATDVLVKYTYAGDANLDGLISGDDYSAIDFAVGMEGASGYFNGDFNYDGIISGDDYAIIDFNLVAQAEIL